MEINIRITDALTDEDRRILTAIAGIQQAKIDFPSQAERIAAGSAVKPAQTAEKEPEKPAPKPAPAKPAAAPKPPAKPTPKPAPEPEPEDEEEPTDEQSGPTLDDAIAKATALVGDGKAADVKVALETVGAKKVSELKGEKIAQFLEALDA